MQNEKNERIALLIEHYLGNIVFEYNVPLR